MKCKFEPLCDKHRNQVIDIYNYYIENSFAAYPEKKVSYDFYSLMLDKIKGYPGYAIVNEKSNQILGFCYLKLHLPWSTLKETVEITYFIDPSEVGKGIGKEALSFLEEKGKENGIKNILASISSLNEQSLIFHRKNGFKECGRFTNVIKKNNVYFDIIWMQKVLE